MSYYPRKNYSRATYVRKYSTKPKYASTTTTIRKKYVPKSKPVAKASRMTDKSQIGITNTFVPATTTARFFGKCRYGAASLSLASSTSQVNSYVFSANGMFDPNITGGALQPAGFSQLISLYEHYTVYKSIISITFSNSGPNPAIVGISLEPDITASTDPNNMLELPYTQTVQLEPQGVYGSSKTVTMSCNLSKYFGTPVTKSNALYRGDSISNPTEQAYFHAKIYGLSGSAASCYLNVKMDYHAIFTESRELSPSLNQKIMNLVIDEDKAEKERKERPLEIKIPQEKPPSGILSGIFS